MSNAVKRNAFNPLYNLPVFGSGSDILLGAMVQRGATPGTNNGELIKASGNSAIPDVIGRLQEIHDFSVTGDNLIAGTAFVTHPVQLIHPFGLFRMEYDQSSLITCTQAVNTTTMTVTSLEDNIDACFIYVVSGTGAGQTNYATASAGGALTLKAAFATDLDTSSKFIKILPRFHQVMSLNSDGTKIASQDAIGTVTVMTIETLIERNSDGGRAMDPTKHAALTGLDNLRQLKFYSDVAFRNTTPYSID